MGLKRGQRLQGDMTWEILRPYAAGNMSRLYMVRLSNTNINAIMKAGGSQLARACLAREARLLAQLRMEGIPQVYDYGEGEDYSYYVMSYYPGVTLERYIAKRGKLSEREVADLGKKLCGILVHLQERARPIVHNDIKPSNILLQEDGSPVLLDFGLAEYRGERRQDIFFQGTLGYAAPECWHLQEVGVCAATDVFALGVVLYFLLTGRNPETFGRYALDGESAQKKNRWEPVLEKCCALDIRNRYQSAAQVYHAIDGIRF